MIWKGSFTFNRCNFIFKFSKRTADLSITKMWLVMLYQNVHCLFSQKLSKIRDSRSIFYGLKQNFLWAFNFTTFRDQKELVNKEKHLFKKHNSCPWNERNVPWTSILTWTAFPKSCLNKAPVNKREKMDLNFLFEIESQRFV